MILEKGTIVMFSSGDYSDYGINGVFKVLADFDTKDMMAGYKKKVSQSERRSEGFIAYLAKARLIEDFETRELHLGSDSELEIE